MNEPQTMTNPYAPPQAVVRDIADQDGLAAPAERSTRLGASVLDAVIAMTMVYVPVGLAVFTATAAGRNSGATPMAIAVGMSGAVVWCYLTYTHVKRTGQSLGKKLLGIKVVRADGTPASVGRIFWLRNVVNGLIGIVPILGAVYGLADVLFIFSDSRQCLHDRLADTIVVKA